MVDNFDIIRKMLHFDNEGECYYVQLLRRAADDPKPDGKPDPAYHGNMHSRSVKDYFIHSLEHLDRVEGEIKELCRMFNVRAYIRLNRRSYKKIALQMLKHIAEQVSSGESYSSPHHMISSAAGMVHDEPNKTWLVDLDTPYLEHEEQIKNLICECEPIKSRIADMMKFLSFGDEDTQYRHCRKAYIEQHMLTIPTKSGKHIIVQPFNKKEFSDKWPSAGLAYRIVFSYDPRITLCVSARTPWNECRSFRHCAELPEEYFSLVVVEHRAVSGVNRYGLGKFVTRDDAKSVMDSMVKLLGGDPKMGSKDIYVVPFDVVKDFPYGSYDNRMDMDKVPDYLVDAYDEAMKKFLGEEDTGRPRIKGLLESVGIAQKVETPIELSNEDKVAMVTRLRQQTKRGLMPCKRALEECGWDYDKAYALVKGLPSAQASEEPSSDEKLTDMEARTLKNKMVAELVYRTGWGPYHCKKALEACIWNLDAAERMLKEKFKDFATKK